MDTVKDVEKYVYIRRFEADLSAPARLYDIAEL